MKATIVADRATGTARVYTPYDETILAIIRAIPGRRWNGDRKHWVVPVDMVSGLARDLRSAGIQVTVEGVDPPKPPPRRGAPTADWATALLGALYDINPLLAEKAFAQLVKVLHPDLGHDTGRLMQQLNDARAKLQRRSA